MRKRIIISAVVATVLAVLVAGTAFADGGYELTAASSTVPSLVSIQASSGAKATMSTAKEKRLAKKTKTMRAQYRAVLKRAVNGTGEFKAMYRKSYSSLFGRYDYYAYWYTLFDVDRNGTPEFFVHASPGYDTGARWFAFTIKSGKAKRIGTFGDGQMLLARKGRALYEVRYHMGVETVRSLKFNKGKVKECKTSVAGKSLKRLENTMVDSASGINKAKVTK